MKSTAIYLDGKLIGEYGEHPNSERHAWGPAVKLKCPFPKRYLRRKYRPSPGAVWIEMGQRRFPATVIIDREDGREIIRIERT